MSNRFQRPAGTYSGDLALNNYNKYQNDSTANPKVSISSVKMDGDFNYLINTVNTLNDELQGVVLGALPDGSIAAGKLAAGAVVSASLAAEAVTAAALAPGAVGSNALASQAVTGNKIASLTIGNTHLADGSISNDKIPDGAIALTKIQNQPAQSLLVNNTALSAPPTALGIAASSLLGGHADGTLGNVTLGAGLSMVGSTLRAEGKVLKLHPIALKTDTFTTNSTSFVDITGLSVTLTPQSAQSKFMLVAHVTGTGADGNSPIGLLLVRDTTPLGQATGVSNRSAFTFVGAANAGSAANLNTSAFSMTDAPATTASITYKIQTRLHNTATTQFINRSLTDADTSAYARGSSSLIVVEYID